MKSQNEKSPNTRLGEQRLIKDDLLLDWFPEETKQLDPLKTSTLNFMQRGNNQKESHSN